MKVKVSYTVEVTDSFRRALRAYRGDSGLATREEVKQHYQQHGGTLDDDLIFEYSLDQSLKEQEPNV